MMKGTKVKMSLSPTLKLQGVSLAPTGESELYKNK
jgi:hypothetical protein